MTGFVRTQSYADGDTILAEHSNDEFDLLEAAFDTSTGHKHDGSVGSGGYINRISDNDADTYVDVEGTGDQDAISFYTNGAKKLQIDASGLLLSDRFRLSVNLVSDSLDIYVE